jgi:hypothetical protein
VGKDKGKGRLSKQRRRALLGRSPWEFSGEVSVSDRFSQVVPQRRLLAPVAKAAS